MNVVPAFLRKQEPAPPPLPRVRQPEEMRQMALDFMSDVDRQREENAYLRSANEQLRVDLKAALENARMLESELAYVRDERDQLYRHDHNMLGGLGAIKAAIINLEQQSRASAYAPPGSGTEDHTKQGDELADGVAKLAATFAPAPEKSADA